MDTKSERNEQAKARARALAATLFAEKGFRETTTRELAAAMNVTNGTFYYYFDSKEDLLYQISLNALLEITTAVTDALDGEDDVETRLRRLIAAHMVTSLGSPDSHKTALELNWRSLTGDKRHQVIEARGAYEALLRGEVQSAQAVGFLREDTDPRILTLLLLNLMNWTIFWYRAERGPTTADLIAEIQQLFLEGARAK
jgi:AcrR family transcriptional regulator